MSHPTRVRGLKQEKASKVLVWYGSHPTRVRGLKLGLFINQYRDKIVAPYAGAWIETFRDFVKGGMFWKSHPTRVRGLKLNYLLNKFFNNVVAPYAGAWIETLEQREKLRDLFVAPYAGAWIET